jgi:hypothetical protein
MISMVIIPTDTEIVIEISEDVPDNHISTPSAAAPPYGAD